MNATTPHPSPLPERSGEGGRFSEAREIQWTWKTAAMEVMAVAVCRLALVRGTSGEFSANDLKLDQHGGAGIAGAVFHRLAKDEVITPVVIWAGTDHQQKYVRNPGGNKVGVWRLKNHSRASTLLNRHERRVSEQQKQILTQAALPGWQ